MAIKITLDDAEIQAALTAHLKAKIPTVDTNSIDITVVAGRQPAGPYAEVSFEFEGSKPKAEPVGQTDEVTSKPKEKLKGLREETVTKSAAKQKREEAQALAAKEEAEAEEEELDVEEDNPLEDVETSVGEVETDEGDDLIEDEPEEVEPTTKRKPLFGRKSK